MGKGLGPDDVTAKQRAAYEMRKSGSKWEEIGQALEMSPQSARSAVAGAERHGLPPLPKRAYRLRAETTDPEAAKRLAESLGTVAAASGNFDMKAFLEVAAAAGIPPRMAVSLGRRVQANYGPVREELKHLNLKELADATQKKAQLVLSYIDETVIAGASVKDLATAYGILIDKSQVLGGRPTQIFDFNMRRKIEVLMPEFLAEARRRGITIEGEFSRDPVPALPADG